MIKSWNEITINQYKKFIGMQGREDFLFHLVAAIKGLTYEQVLAQPIGITTKWTNEARELLETKPKTHKLKWNYTINGKEYHLSANPNEITTAQYIDFYNAPKEVPDNMAALIAIFLIPKGHKYSEGYDIKEVTMEFEKHMGIEDALAVYNFFTVLFQYYLKRAMRRTRKVLKQMKRKGSPEIKEKVEETEKALKVFETMVKESRAINGSR